MKEQCATGRNALEVCETNLHQSRKRNADPCILPLLECQLVVFRRWLAVVGPSVPMHQVSSRLESSPMVVPWVQTRKPNYVLA